MRNLQHIIDREIAAIRKYAKDFKCTISDAAFDVLTDQPCTFSLAEKVCTALGIWAEPRFSGRRWETIEEVNGYERELYEI